MSNSDQYNKLKKIWDKKLAKSGFKDIEKNEYDFKPNKSSAIFTRTTGRSQSSLTPISMAAKRDYYIMAEHFLNDHEFESRLDKIIWEYHANGISVRNIAITLNKVRKKKIYKSQVWLIVNRLEQAMKNLYQVTK